MLHSLEFPYPPALRSYYKYNRRGVQISDKGLSYRRLVQTHVLVNRFVTGLVGPLRMSLYFNPPDRRKRDLDNNCKAFLDSLEKSGVYADDYQIAELHLYRRDPVKRGCVWCEIEEINQT